jgi:hypothetical protein
MDASRTRDKSPCPIGFIGDLDDPWIVGIADALATGRRVHRSKHAGPLPDRPFGEAALPRAIVIHRHKLSAVDAERLKEWRAREADSAPELILSISPYVRYEELERWSSLVDLVVSEAVAGEILPGRLARRLDGYDRRPPSGRPVCRIEVAGGDGELCRALVDVCARAGYAARAVEDREIGGGPTSRERDRGRSAGGRVLTIWEVPVLEPGWAQRLEWRAHRTGPVIALAGFADRAVVTRAKQAGAVACLELPCDLDDLVDVVDRVVAQTPPESWPIPPRVEPPHRLPPARRNPRSHRLLVAPSRWPESEAPPTIPAGRDMK